MGWIVRSFRVLGVFLSARFFFRAVGGVFGSGLVFIRFGRGGRLFFRY